MSPGKLAQMQSSKIAQGCGGKTFISTNGAADFKGAASKGSVYIEFEVPSSGLLQGGKEGCDLLSVITMWSPFLNEWQ